MKRSPSLPKPPRYKEVDPRVLPVQIAFRVPNWYHRQLADLANELGVTIPKLVADLCMRVLKPEPPK